MMVCIICRHAMSSMSFADWSMMTPHEASFTPAYENRFRPPEHF